MPPRLAGALRDRLTLAWGMALGFDLRGVEMVVPRVDDSAASCCGWSGMLFRKCSPAPVWRSAWMR